MLQVKYMKIATISSKRQITLPKDILENLHVDRGSKVVLYPDRNILLIKPLKNSIVEQTAGSLAHLVPPEKRGVPWAKVMKETQKIVAKKLAEGS